jgi:hypothetical protein
MEGDREAMRRLSVIPFPDAYLLLLRKALK